MKHKILNCLSLVIFWLAVILITVIIFSLTIGQLLPIEFKTHQLHNRYYSFAFTGLPIAILLTIFRTIKKENKRLKNRLLTIATIILALLSYVAGINTLLFTGFGAWKNEEILYRNQNNKDITINYQRFDLGALGYGNDRIVQLKPFLLYFQTVKMVKPAKLDEKQWIPVNEDLHLQE